MLVNIAGFPTYHFTSHWELYYHFIIVIIAIDSIYFQYAEENS